MITIGKTILLLMLFLTLPVFANPFSYSCKITSEYNLSSDGELLLDNKIYAGSEFKVDRKTGVVLGGGVGNSSYPIIEVLDSGEQGQTYKLLMLSKTITGTSNGRNVMFLNIREYETGDKKPFTLLVNTRVLTGLCE